MPNSLFLAIIVLVALAGWVFVSFYRKHMQGENAPEKKVDVTVLDKQSIDLPDAEPGQEDQEYWIYVQRGLV
ncbi:DUF2500 family protein, partial [Vibrio sp. D173a]